MTSQPSFDPLDLLRVAEFLAERDSSEASLRTAVSRTYYGVLLAVTDSLGVSRGRSIHSRAIGEMLKRDRQAGLRLRSLMLLRILADYELEVQDPLRTNWRRNYRLARSFADSVINRLRRIQREGGGAP